ncbi:MAG TPA: WhiB family transcriptional regulator [Jatrophihabitantaceae bacterium]|jgi:hypothetical protein|nr:WhiB family transcriptional regulator [Jatrophihabitantaceae bacterium]
MNAREIGPLRGAVWQLEAACAEPATAGLPWTLDHHLLLDAERDALRTVCQSCPVQLQCAAFADELGATVGFWAGRDRDADRIDIPQQLRLARVS